ncbi:MAG: ferrous iron transport protein B [Dictyoglomus sp. NZ13-RE01]|nr:MAG: ferrous iron transport protein B [Dictyoglomus sp. NZ13-RE01]
MKKKIRVALAGNPNVGKSTVFNLLTGLRQHVGNWPGKTVEKKEGIYETNNYIIEIIDLPGTYSLSYHSLEEQIARDFIINEKPDIVVVIADATALERNLYLLSQLLELHPKIILAINMIDLLKEKKYKLNFERLSKKLGIPVVPMIASKGEGIKELVNNIINLFENKIQLNLTLPNYQDLEPLISELENILSSKECSIPVRWLAIKILENDQEFIEYVKKNYDFTIIQKIIGKREDLPVLIASYRYKWIKDLLKDVLEKPKTQVITLTDKLDTVFTHPILGFFIALFVLFSIFYFTYFISGIFIEPWSKILDYFKLLLQNTFNFLPNFLNNFTFDGIWSGVSILFNFIPLLVIFLFFLALLEDTGYLARIAFVTDRLMHTLGLHGKSFIPLILSSGCNVVGIMGTRTIEDEKDRTLLILVSSFIPCLPRIIVSAFFISIFFPKYSALVLISLYLISLFSVFINSKIIGKFIIKTSFNPLIMELPLYKLPNMKVVLLYIWENLKSFLRRAGTVIVLLSGIIWILSNYPSSNLEDSFLSQLGKIILPIFKTMGFNWQLVIALITGFVAKESSLSTLSTIYQKAGLDLTQALKTQFTPTTIYAFLVMQLLYIPCLATLATIYKETHSKKWTAFSVFYSLVYAYILSFIVYIIGGLLWKS